MDKVKDVPLSQLALSVRAYHVCQSARLDTLRRIEEYYKYNNTFLNLRNCGIATERELINFINTPFPDLKLINGKYHSFVPGYAINDSPIMETAHSRVELPCPESTEYKLLKSFLFFMINRLPLRCRKFIKNTFNAETLLPDFVNHIPVRESPVYQIIGAGTFAAINKLFLVFKRLIELLQNNEGGEMDAAVFSMYALDTCSLSQKELDEFFESYIYFKGNIIDMTFDEYIAGLIDGLSLQKRKILEGFIRLEISAMPDKNRAALYSISHSPDHPGEIEMYLSVNKSSGPFNKLPRSIRFSLYNFKKRIYSYMQTLLKMDEDRNTGESISIILKEYFNITNTDLKRIGLNDKPGSPVFRIIKVLLQGRYIYNDTALAVLRNYADFFAGQPHYPLEKIGQQLNLSRERIRQISEKTEEQFPLKFAFLKYFDITKIEPCRSFLKQDIVFVDDCLARDINRQEGTAFSKLFYFKILGILLDDEFTCFVSQAGKKMYLISSEAFKAFDFGSFMQHMYKEYNDREPEVLYPNLDYLLLHFSKPGSGSLGERITSICEKLLLCEFSAALDAGRNIILKRKFQTTANLVYHFLKEAGRPMTYPELSAEFTKARRGNRRDHLWSLQICKRKDLFVRIGRSNCTYALKAWEDNALIINNLIIRGGSTTGMVLEYLERSEGAVHISELTNHIRQYRNTDSEHISALIQTDKKFVKFCGDYWGLSDRNYKGMNLRLANTNREVISRRVLKDYEGMTMECVAKKLSEIYNKDEKSICASLKRKKGNGRLILSEGKIYLPEPKGSRAPK